MTNLTKELFSKAGIEPELKQQYDTGGFGAVWDWEYPDLTSNTPEAALNREKLLKLFLNHPDVDENYISIFRDYSSNSIIIRISINFPDGEETFKGEGWTFEEALLNLAIKVVDEIKDELRAVEREG